MLIAMNKWCAIWSFFHLLVTNKLFVFIEFALTHPQFRIDLFEMSLAAFVGQIFVYRMIK
jgi:hypothetical protein